MDNYGLWFVVREIKVLNLSAPGWPRAQRSCPVPPPPRLPLRRTPRGPLVSCRHASTATLTLFKGRELFHIPLCWRHEGQVSLKVKTASRALRVPITVQRYTKRDLNKIPYCQTSFETATWGSFLIPTICNDVIDICGARVAYLPTSHIPSMIKTIYFQQGSFLWGVMETHGKNEVTANVKRPAAHSDCLVFPVRCWLEPQIALYDSVKDLNYL